MTTWNLFPTLSAPMPLQMAIDRLLFEQHHRGCADGAEPRPILRIFYSSEPWCSVGYAAEKKSGYFLESSRHALQTLPVCRRVTGGGTVIHGQDLIFALCARKEDDPVKFESVETSYRHLHEAVKIAFEKLGMKPEFYRDQRLQTGRDCFLFPVETDLRLEGKKIAGGAQKRSGTVFLHEESIQPPEEISLVKLEAEILNAFENYFNIKMERILIDPELIAEAEKIAPDSVLKVSELNIWNSAV